MTAAAEARCDECNAPLLVRRDTTTYRPHLTWCPWAWSLRLFAGLSPRPEIATNERNSS